MAIGAFLILEAGGWRLEAGGWRLEAVKEKISRKNWQSAIKDFRRKSTIGNLHFGI